MVIGGEDFVGLWDLIKNIKFGRKTKKPLTNGRKKILARRAQEKKNRQKSQ